MAEPSIKDLAYRTAAGVFGGPVDLATMVMRPFGYKTPDEQVFGSSEYIGKKLEDVGLVSSARSPLTEFIASVAVPTPGGIAKGAALAAPLIGGMFVGKGAKTWDALAAAKAKMMADMGTDARTIWKETGTWKGPDGKWRQEIDDSGAKVRNLSEMQFGNKETLQQGQSAVGPVKDFMLHKNLSRAYDGLMDFGKGNQRLTMRVNPDNADGFFNENLGHIEVGMKDQSINKSTAIHELQHAIQGREGFARGGNPEMFSNAREMVDEWSKTANQIDIGYELKQLMQSGMNLGEARNAYKAKTGIYPDSEAALFAKDYSFEQLTLEKVNAAKKASEYADSAIIGPHGMYQRLAGEAEARATQARMNMTPVQRRAMFPEESYDVPINELIIRGASD